MRLIIRSGIVAVALLLALRASAEPDTATREFPAFSAADPNAPAVTAANVFSAERFWPYQVEIPSSSSAGVLIRVEEHGLARIDFGRDGLREVPIATTDLVARANHVRTGELAKIAPNLVLAIGPRLLDPSGPILRPLSLESVARNSGFLCVFADPTGAQFPALAKALAPLELRHGVQTILFPQGRAADVHVGGRLHSLGWPVPFVYEHLSEAYTRTLLPADLAAPAVLLTTPEGRVVLQGAWSEGLAVRVARALDANFAAAAAADRD